MERGPILKSHRIRKPPSDNQGWKREYKQAEKAVHKAYVAWLRENYDVEIIHLVNEGNIPPQYRKLLLALGLRPGASDLLCLWANKGILFHELKALSGKVSSQQRDFEASVTSKGFPCITTYGLDRAQEIPGLYGFPVINKG